MSTAAAAPVTYSAPMSYSYPAAYSVPQMTMTMPMASYAAPAAGGASYVPPVVLDSKTIAEQQAQANKQLEEQATRLASAAKVQYEAQKTYLLAESKRVEQISIQQIQAAADQQVFQLDFEKREQELRIEQEYQNQRASILSTAQALTAQAQQAAATKAMAEAMAKVQPYGAYNATMGGNGGFTMPMYTAGTYPATYSYQAPAVAAATLPSA